MPSIKYLRRFPSKSADYVKAKKIVDTLDVLKDVTISVDKLSNFKGYLSRLGTAENKQYSTKLQPDDRLYILRVK